MIEVFDLNHGPSSEIAGTKYEKGRYCVNYTTGFVLPMSYFMFLFETAV
jgi:hypothetical protein